MNYYEIRKSLKLSQMEVAKTCGVSLITYQMWERGISTPTPENLIKLKKALQINN
jgi:transcriptional regulator with XRE-family HTH domain